MICIFFVSLFMEMVKKSSKFVVFRLDSSTKTRQRFVSSWRKPVALRLIEQTVILGIDRPVFTALYLILIENEWFYNSAYNNFLSESFYWYYDLWEKCTEFFKSRLKIIKQNIFCKIFHQLNSHLRQQPRLGNNCHSEIEINDISVDYFQTQLKRADNL